MAAAAADPTQQLPSPAETDGEEEVPSEKDKAKKEKAIEKKQKRAASVLSAQEVPVDVLLHFKGKQPPGKCTIAGCLEACHTVLLLRRHLAKCAPAHHARSCAARSSRGARDYGRQITRGGASTASVALFARRNGRQTALRHFCRGLAF